VEAAALGRNPQGRAGTGRRRAALAKLPALAAAEGEPAAFRREVQLGVRSAGKDLSAELTVDTGAVFVVCQDEGVFAEAREGDDSEEAAEEVIEFSMCY
jgi:hypothetical protein